MSAVIQRRIILIVAVLCLSAVSVASLAPLTLNTSDATTIWSTTWDGLRAGSVKSTVTSMAVDPNDGTIVSVGFASGTFLGHANVGGFDAFVTKTSPAGANIWSRWLTTAQDDIAMGVCIDSSGAIYVTGHTSGYLQGSTNAGSVDHFMVKMTADGDQTWLRQFGTSSTEYAGNCAVDVFGNLYVVGMSNGQIFPGASTSGYYQIYFARIAPSSGLTVWGKAVNLGTAHQYLYGATFTDVQFLNQWPAGRGIAVINPIINVTTNVTVVISFYTGNPLSYTDAPITGVGNADTVVGAYNGISGAFRWANYYQSVSDDIVTSTTTDASGATFVVGYTSSNLDHGYYSGGGNPDVFLSKLDFNGNKLWTRVYGTMDAEYGSSVTVDNAGGVYVSGFEGVVYNDAIMLDGYASPYYILETSGGYSVYVAFVSKFDSDGSRLWTAPYGVYMPNSENYYYPPGMQPYTSIVDPNNGNLYLAGKKTGIWTSDTWPLSLSNTDLWSDQAFLIAVTQPPTNCTLQQLDQLLAQIDSLLIGL